MTICVNESHYPIDIPLTLLTVDPRLHFPDEHGADCFGPDDRVEFTGSKGWLVLAGWVEVPVTGAIITLRLFDAPPEEVIVTDVECMPNETRVTYQRRHGHRFDP